MKTINKIISTVLINWLSACQTNSFYWKEGTQLISRCDEGALNTIIIRDSVGATTIYMQRRGDGLHEIDLTSKLPEYSVSVQRGEYRKRVDQFVFRPNTQYEISHSAPNDAVIARIKIITNKEGRIKYASKTTCD